MSFLEKDPLIVPRLNASFFLNHNVALRQFSLTSEAKKSLLKCYVQESDGHRHSSGWYANQHQKWCNLMLTCSSSHCRVI